MCVSVCASLCVCLCVCLALCTCVYKSEDTLGHQTLPSTLIEMPLFLYFAVVYARLAGPRASRILRSPLSIFPLSSGMHSTTPCRPSPLCGCFFFIYPPRKWTQILCWQLRLKLVGDPIFGVSCTHSPYKHHCAPLKK